jgi:hypothetical protein
LPISKSDFKVGHDCPHKLRYRKAGYPSRLGEDDYLQFFADCGFMVEALAHALFPNGRPPTPLPDESPAAATAREFSEPGDRVWFEPTFLADGFSARIDLLVRSGSHLDLIEIKAKSFDPDEDDSLWKESGGIRTEWESYLIDLTFQTMVTRLALPSYTIAPKLCLVDRTATCSEDALYDKIMFAPSDRSAPRAVFVGDADKLRDDHMLVFLDVAEYVDYLMPRVIELAQHLHDALEDPVLLGPPPLGPNCRNCEFRDFSLRPHGFAECWGDLASADPHILDLYYASSIGERGGLERLVAQGIASTTSVDESLIDESKAVGRRQLRQIRALKAGREQYSAELNCELNSLAYPLHFLDFETSRIPVPYHAGMNPYEQIAFQFSCHTVQSAGSTELEHHDWINTEDAYPSFEFARNLREVLGDAGTILIWSPHEQTTIRDITEQAMKYGFRDDDLLTWLSSVHLATKDGGRIFDLMRLCERAYYHPNMRGRVGIKYVLSAIWQDAPWLWSDPWFKEYAKLNESGEIVDPYMSLSAEPFAYASERLGLELDAVREGVGAMRTYQEMLYGVHRHDEDFRNAQRELLLQYCKLDTAAMVIIWKYWSSLVV